MSSILPSCYPIYVNFHGSNIIYHPTSAASCIMHHPSSRMHHPSSRMHHVSCILNRPACWCILYHASSIFQRASCIMLHLKFIIHCVSSIMHHASTNNKACLGEWSILGGMLLQPWWLQWRWIFERKNHISNNCRLHLKDLIWDISLFSKFELPWNKKGQYLLFP